jgi:hypothetical protein
VLASLAHVTIWSDLSVPVLGFDVYLTGFRARGGAAAAEPALLANLR